MHSFFLIWLNREELSVRKRERKRDRKKTLFKIELLERISLVSVVHGLHQNQQFATASASQLSQNEKNKIEALQICNANIVFTHMGRKWWLLLLLLSIGHNEIRLHNFPTEWFCWNSFIERVFTCDGKEMLEYMMRFV